MKVLMIGTGDPPPTFIERQIENLQKAEIQVNHLPPFKSHQYLNRVLCRQGFTFHLSHEMKACVNEADILHFQWPGHWITYHSLAKKYRKKTVLSLRGRQINLLPYEPGIDGYVKNLKRALTHCDGYHAVSKAILKKAQEYGLDPKRARVIYTAVDTDFFCPPNFRPNHDPLSILMVGALIKRKAYEDALKALKLIIDQGVDAQLIIVGEGNERENILATLLDLDLKPFVKLTGQLSPYKVRNLLQKAHIFLNTSLSEGLANSVIEAMSCALPVVTTDAGGMSEAITDGIEGLLVPIQDPETVADALQNLFSSVVLREEMGIAGRSRVLSSFTNQIQTKQFTDFYNWILS